MPIYTYQCDCGYKHEQFLTQDKAEVLLKCLRCTRNITARQIRDKSITFAEKDLVTGVMRNEKRQT